jgi:60 kDa SS-A/Ro ribonucleoprotein
MGGDRTLKTFLLQPRREEDVTMNYAQHFAPRDTPATEQADPRQVPNSTGGWTFQIDKWKQLERFLILGAEGGTYYASERELTVENAKIVQSCLKENGLRAVEIIWATSVSGRAPKNDPAVFALALAAAADDERTRAAALKAMPKVCRIGTHLFQFVEAVQTFRGWGRALKRGVAAWYEEKSTEDLCHQVAKYAQRGGFSHRDVLRLAHPQNTAERAPIYRYIVSGSDGIGATTVKRKTGTTEARPSVELPAYLLALEELKKAEPKRCAELIREHNFTHEMVTGEQKRSREVWEALYERMPMTALIRNLAKLTQLGIVAPLSEAAVRVAERITDRAQLKKARVHPIHILTALATYRQGHGDKGSLTWSPVAQILEALDAGFYAAFDAVEPTGKATMVCLDVSGSMNCAAFGGLTARHISTAMAMTVVRTEPTSMVVAFSRGLSILPITKSQRLDDVTGMTDGLPFEYTDCSLPLRAALEQKLPVEVFNVWTDNETNAGTQPHLALRELRQQSGIPAKLSVAAVTSTGFTIADPSDPGMLDCVGFDANVPAVLADFARAG